MVRMIPFWTNLAHVGMPLHKRTVSLRHMRIAFLPMVDVNSGGEVVRFNDRGDGAITQSVGSGVP